MSAGGERRKDDKVTCVDCQRLSRCGVITLLRGYRDPCDEMLEAAIKILPKYCKLFCFRGLTVPQLRAWRKEREFEAEMKELELARRRHNE